MGRKKALLAGKHVLVEKPLGVSIEECASLQSAVAASGLVLQVGTMKRFDPGIAFARQFIAEEMGEMLALKAWYCDSTYRYVMTDNCNRSIDIQRRRETAGRRSESRPAPLFSARPRQPSWSILPAFSADRSKPCARNW